MQPLIVEPYITVADFKAHPTYLALNNLRPGATAAAQDAELNNLLIEASDWASYTVCNQPLHAHTVTGERERVRLDRQGRLKYHAANKPVRRVTGLSWGYDPTAMNAVTDLTGVWVEKDVQVVASLAPLSRQFGQLQFGPAGRGEIYTDWTYVAGFPVTTLAAPAVKPTSSVQPKDTTGIYPGDVLRIWEPGAEEAVVVAPGYVPGAATVPLTSPLVNDHTAGAGISAMPPGVRLAVVNYTVALLTRPPAQTQDAFPNARVSATTRKGDSRQDGSGLVAEARRMLRSYGRVR